MADSPEIIGLKAQKSALQQQIDQANANLPQEKLNVAAYCKNPSPCGHVLLFEPKCQYQEPQCGNAQAAVAKYEGYLASNPGAIYAIDQKIADLGKTSTTAKWLWSLLAVGILVGGFFFGKYKGWWGVPDKVKT